MIFIILISGCFPNNPSRIVMNKICFITKISDRAKKHNKKEKHFFAKNRGKYILLAIMINP